MEQGRRARTDLYWALGIIVLSAFLASGLLPNFTRQRAQGRGVACNSNLKNLGTALEMYAEDHGKRFPPSLAKLTPKYLKNIPTCPTVGRDTYTHSYFVVHARDTDAYTVYCRGNNHEGSGYPPDFPQYTSRAGLLQR